MDRSSRPSEEESSSRKRQQQQTPLEQKQQQQQSGLSHQREKRVINHNSSRGSLKSNARNSRESIRKKLASWTEGCPQGGDRSEEGGEGVEGGEGEEGGGGAGAAGTNLMVCFMNEALIDEEKEESSSSSSSSSSSEEEVGEEGEDSGVVEKISASYIARNNISRKKNHVIIPLNNCSSNRHSLNGDAIFSSPAAVTSQPSVTPNPDGPPPLPSEAETLSLWLLQIQVDAREKLKAAKSAAKILAASEREQCQLSLDLERLFGLKMNRKLSRQFLTDRNIAQLQVILNYLLTRIEELNEKLVQILMIRDDLAMEQDSLLTDIEDITKGIAAAN